MKFILAISLSFFALIGFSQEEILVRTGVNYSFLAFSDAEENYNPQVGAVFGLGWEWNAWGKTKARFEYVYSQKRTEMEGASVLKINSDYFHIGVMGLIPISNGLYYGCGGFADALLADKQTLDAGSGEVTLEGNDRVNLNSKGLGITQRLEWQTKPGYIFLEAGITLMPYFDDPNKNERLIMLAAGVNWRIHKYDE